MSKLKNKQGISLVALIITIIVLIILTAAVVITGINTPENTEYVVKMHNKATLQDAVTLYVMTEMLNDIDGFVTGTIDSTKARDVADVVKDLYENGTWKEDAEKKLRISMTLDELNTVFELDDKAVVTFAKGQEPTLDGTEGGNNDNIPEFTQPIYYSSLSAALSDTTQTGDADTDSAAVNVYTNIQSGAKILQLQKDITLTETLNIEEGLTLDLNGYTIESTATVGIRTQSEDVIIEASKTGSSIEMNPAVGEKGTAISVMSGECTINGGTYTSNTSGAGTKDSQAQVIYAESGTILNMADATIIAVDDNNGCVAGIRSAGADTELNIDNCDITVESGRSLENIGIISKGNAVIRDSSIIAKADYVANAAGNNYGSTSRGIYSYADLELYNCYVWGAHSGVTAKGNVYVDGGIYEGYGHGAFYLCTSNTTSYFYNAELSWAPMPDGTVSDTIAGTNGAGFYIGNGADNVTVYIDNCDFNMNEENGELYKGNPVPVYGIVFRTSGGESNNIAYISNSYVEMANTVMFRGAGTSGHTVYNGVGNDWSAAAEVHSTNSTYFIDTEDSYERID